MTNGVRTSVLALGVAAFASLSPLSAANAATTVHHPARAVHGRTAHVYGRVTAHHNVHRYAHHYAHRYGHRYAYGYGYNPGAAAAAGVIGGILGGLVGGYPYSCDDYYYGPYGACGYYGDYGYGYPDYGFGYGYAPYYYGGYGGYGGYGRGFHGRGFAGGHFGHFERGHMGGGFGGGRFAGGHMGGGFGGHFAGGNFGHMGAFGGHFAGGNFGHTGGFGGGHFGSRRPHGRLRRRPHSLARPLACRILLRAASGPPDSFVELRAGARRKAARLLGLALVSGNCAAGAGVFFGADGALRPPHTITKGSRHDPNYRSNLGHCARPGRFCFVLASCRARGHLRRAHTEHARRLERD